MKNQTNSNETKRLFVALALWIISIILKYVIAIFSIVINTIYFVGSIKWKTGRSRLADHLMNRAISNDQHGNVCHAKTFQYLMTKPGGEKFGNPDDTISYVLGRNMCQGKLYILGKPIAKVLDLIEKDHLLISIESKIEADQDALLRIQQNQYFKK